MQTIRLLSLLNIAMMVAFVMMIDKYKDLDFENLPIDKKLTTVFFLASVPITSLMILMATYFYGQ